MPDFEQTRAALAKARTDLAGEDDAVRAAVERVVRARDAQRSAERIEGHDGPSAAALAQALADAEGKLDDARASLATARAAEAAARSAFAALVDDPTKQIATLSAETPILLLPVRVETRFKTTAGRRELWIRVYPDQC